MPLDFPSNPTNGQTYENFQYDSSITAWRNFGTPNALGAQVAALQTANATTNKAGLVPVIPTSVAVGSGSGSVDANGLVTFTGVSSISLNNVFSSAYRNYRVQISITAATGYNGNTLGYRYRTTSDETQSLYYFGGQYVFANGTAGVLSSGDNAGSYGKLCWMNAGMIYGGSSFDLHNPNLNVVKNVFFHGAGSHPTGSIYNYGSGIMYSATAYTGISFLSDGTGTFTGTVKIYGYN